MAESKKPAEGKKKAARAESIKIKKEKPVRKESIKIKKEKPAKAERVKKKEEKPAQNYDKQSDASFFIGVGIGVILLVLTEIGCILAQIYYMLSGTRAVAMLVISALLLLVITGAFLCILKNTLFAKMDEQKRLYEEMLRINKATYMKAKRIFGQSGGSNMEAGGFDSLISDRVLEDMERIQKEQGEELYKRQMAVAKVQIKRTRESVMNMVRANEYIIDVIEEKLGADSPFASQEAAIGELQNSVAQLYALCEKIAGGQVEAPVLEKEIDALPEMEEEIDALPEMEEEIDALPEMEEEIDALPEMEEDIDALPEMEEDIDALPEMEEDIDALPEIEEELSGVQDFAFEQEDFLPEMEFEPEGEEEYLSETEDLQQEPAGVDIEPLPEEVLENIDIPEMEDLLPEPDGFEVEEQPSDPNRPMTPEEIEKLLNSL